MRRLIREVSSSDPEAAAWLKVIDAFDQVVSSQATLEQVAKTASRLSGRAAGIDETLTGRRIVVGADQTPPLEDRSARDDDVVRNIIAARLRGRRSAVVRSGDEEVIAGAIEVASGRIGVAWLHGSDRPFTSIDHLVAERLAAAAAIDAVRARSELDARARVDPGAVERLLSGPIGQEEAAQASRRAHLPAGRSYVAIAGEEWPESSLSREAAAQVLVREAIARGLIARGTVVDRLAAVVCEDGKALGEALQAAVAAVARTGRSVAFGVGERRNLASLHRSWFQAREALMLRSAGTSDGAVVHFRDLGILHLLAQIPADALEEFAEYRQLADFPVRAASPTDLELLEAFLEAGSLRKTAVRVHLHHASVEYRLRRIEEELGVDLGEAADRLRMQIALKLLRIQRARSR